VSNSALLVKVFAPLIVSALFAVNWIAAC